MRTTLQTLVYNNNKLARLHAYRSACSPHPGDQRSPFQSHCHRWSKMIRRAATNHVRIMSLFGLLKGFSGQANRRCTKLKLSAGKGDDPNKRSLGSCKVFPGQNHMMWSWVGTRTKPHDVVLGRNNFRIVAEGAMLQIFLPHGLKTRRANEGPREDLEIVSALRRFVADPLHSVRMER